MLPESVPPWFIAATAWLVAIPLFLLEISSMGILGLRLDKYAGPSGVLTYFLAVKFLVPQTLSVLGIRVRSRSIERLAAALDREGVATDDLPIRVYRGESLRRWIPAALYLGGSVCLVLAACIAFTWPQPPRAREDPLPLMVALLGIAFVLIAGAFLAGCSKLDPLCEITEKGIRALDGFWGRQTFVPWEELARCEIVHDDERVWIDHFVLWDRSGRPRFRSCQTWLGRLRRSDRDRIICALRARFPQKEEPVSGEEPVLTLQASSTVWDRQLDG